MATLQRAEVELEDPREAFGEEIRRTRIGNAAPEFRGADEPIQGKPPADRAELLNRTREHLVRMNFSIAEMARRIGYTASNLSKYLSGELNNPAPTEIALRAYFAKQEQLAADGKFCMTRVARTVMDVCRETLEQRLLTVIYGLPEIGKTEAVLEFLRRRVANGIGGKVAYIQVKDVDTTKSVIDSMARQLGIRQSASVARMTDLVTTQLKRDPHMLVLDDANYLSVKSLEMFRWIYDQTGCPLLMMGTKQLMERILLSTGRLAEDLVQFYSRVDLQQEVAGGLSREERRGIARCHYPTLGEKDLDLIEQEQYAPRRLVKVLKQVERLRRTNPAAAFPDLLARAKKKVFQAM